ncbi:MAG: glycoside hydrolase family 3 C-terminal domain-containing protein [Mobilitalea sp.]
MSESKMGVPMEELEELTRVVAAQGAVLLKNNNKMLPLRKDEKVAVFGRTQFDYYRSGTGSGGAVNVAYTTNLINSLRESNKVQVNEMLAQVYEEWRTSNPFDNGGGGWAAEPWFQKEMPVSDQLVHAAAEESQKAVMVIGRTAGEDKDNLDTEGSYRLTKQEYEVIQIICKYFTEVAIVLNVSNIMDMSWLEEEGFLGHIKSVLYVWQGGIEGGNAAADVLTGEVTPCGKLPDTIAYSIEDYSSSMNYGKRDRNYYQEDIYVGYRYFETFHPEKVQFEFGYGKSYTGFLIIPQKAAIENVKGNDIFRIQVSVKNIGNEYAGKEVVQIYCEAPQGVLGKAKRVLAAFAKTKLLAPQEEEELAIEFPIERIASYDDSGTTRHKSCFVLEAGQYNFYIGNSVRNTELVEFTKGSGLVLENLIIVKECEEALAPIESFTRLRPLRQRADGTFEKGYEEVPRQTISLSERISDNLPICLMQTGNKGIKLKEVDDSNVSLEEFVAQLTKEELATLVRGEGMCSIKVTPGTAAAFGGVGDNLMDYGIPVACAADGPSGIRMDNGYKATQLPIGTLLAATWDIPLVEELYRWEGLEMLRNKIDTLLGPGINIHRNPLNGRNFEYFSEDPLLTGSFAAAITKGMDQSGVTATVKHFACNNQETDRTTADSVVSERANREIYLKGFEMAVKEGHARSIMTTYNPLNGHWTASNYDLNTTILRKEWGYEGIVMTDWWAKMNDVELGGEGSMQDLRSMVRAQNDLYMVVSNNGAEVNAAQDNILESLENGSLTIGELQRSAINICRFLLKSPAFFREKDNTITIMKIAAKKDLIRQGEEKTSDIKEDYQISLETANSAQMKVAKAGIYSVLVRIMSKENNSAQTVCNAYLNGIQFMTFQTNGTEGRWIVQKLLRIELEAGNYDLQLDFVKPGMQVEWMKFQAAN